MYILSLPSNFDFFPNFVARKSPKTCEKIKVARKTENVHHSTQFFTVIPNMIFLLHKSLVVMEKSENYGVNSYFLTPDSEKMTFLSHEKEFLKKLFIDLKLRI